LQPWEIAGWVQIIGAVAERQLLAIQAMTRYVKASARGATVQKEKDE